MTRAVCLECGAFKVGALARCSCGFDPETPEDQARHLMASDPSLTEEQQLAISDLVRDGGTPEFDEHEVAALAQTVRETPTVPIWYALLVIAVPLALLLSVLVGSAVLLRSCG